MALLAVAVEGFAPSVSSESRLASTRVYGYIPSGFTAETWKKQQEKEAAQKKAKNLGRLGPNGFKSRSFQSFHEALERGEAAHLMPVENAAEKVRKGILKPEDIPYMQRGGNWDNSDIKGARKINWLKSDKEYASGGYKKEQSVSIFGNGEGLDWTGRRSRSGPTPGNVSVKQTKFAKNYKPPNINDEPKKKFFGLF